MEFGLGKFAMLVMKGGKRHRTDVMELSNQDKIRTPREKETYKYFGIRHHQTSTDERKNSERLSQWN